MTITLCHETRCHEAISAPSRTAATMQHTQHTIIRQIKFEVKQTNMVK